MSLNIDTGVGCEFRLVCQYKTQKTIRRFQEPQRTKEK